MEWFGPEELKEVVGGARWWQVRGLSGIDAEWIAEKRDLSDVPANDKGSKHTKVDANIARMEHLDSVMVSIRFCEH